MKFSIVTPSFNSERFISETIESVISQAGKFSIEYIVIDGGSKDRTLEIVKRYQLSLLDRTYPIQCDEVTITWQSEMDGGMYDAIRKGFEKATGDYYAYINSDDIYLPGAFNTIAAVLSKFPEIEWLKGITSFINSNSAIFKAGNCRLYAQDWIRKGVYGRAHYYIQQDSVFWRKSLWEKFSRFDNTRKFANLKLAGDYFLWTEFAKYNPLVSVNAYVSCFRWVNGQLSSNAAAYKDEMNQLCPPDSKLEFLIRKYFRNEARIPLFLRPPLYRLLFGPQIFHFIEINIKNNLDLDSGNYYSAKDKLK